MQQVYGSDCLSRATINEWFRRFKDGREHLTDDERSGRPREAVNESNIEKVRQFIKNESKSTRAIHGNEVKFISNIDLSHFN